MASPKRQRSRTTRVVLAIASAATWAASAQERNIPLPGFVLRDASGALVGQILGYPNLVLVSAGATRRCSKSPRRRSVISSPDWTCRLLPSGRLPGRPHDFVLERAETKTQRCQYGIGADGVVQKVTSEQPCLRHAASRRRSRAPSASESAVHQRFVMGIEGCRMAEPSAIDLSEVQQPFHIE